MTLGIGESLVLALAPSLGKWLLLTVLGKDSLGEALLSSLVELYSAKVKQVWEDGYTEQRLSQITRTTAQHVTGKFASRLRQLEEGEREQLAEILAKTLASVELTPKLIVEKNVDATRLLRECLRPAVPNAAKDLAEKTTALLNDMLAEASRYLVLLAPELNGFTTSFSARVLQLLEVAQQDNEFRREVLQRVAARCENLEKYLLDPDPYEAKYRPSLARKLDKLETFGVPNINRAANPEKFKLSTSFTSPTAEIRYFLEKPRVEVAEAEQPETPKRREETKTLEVEELLRTSRRLVIVGEAGAGKSTLLKYLAVLAAEQKFGPELAEWNAKVPFFIRLRERVEMGFPPAKDFPRGFDYNFQMPQADAWTYDLLASGRAVVLVDGVDEMPVERRDEFLAKLNDLVEDYPYAHFVISSRPSALKDWAEWQSWIRHAQFLQAELQRLRPEKINHLIDRWHEALRATCEPEEQAEVETLPARLRRQLEVSQPLRDLAANPLLCSVICALHRLTPDTLPSTRHELYQQCAEMLLVERDKARGLPTPEFLKNVRSDQLIKLVGRLAFWMLDKQLEGQMRLEVSRAEAAHQLHEQLGAVQITGGTGEEVLSYLLKRSYLLQEPAEGRVDFAHRSFHDFLAAKDIVRHNLYERLLKECVRGDQWDEVAVLTMGLTQQDDKKGEFLTKLVQYSQSPNTQQRLHLGWLAVACLETGRFGLAPEVYQLVLSNADFLMPPTDAREINLIASAGEGAVELLRPRSGYHDLDAANCVKALAEIGTPAALNMLGHYAGRWPDYGQTGRPNWAGRKLDEALIQAGRKFDVNVYFQQVLSRQGNLILYQVPTEAMRPYLLNVQTLTLRGSQIHDLSELVGLISLQELSLSKTPVSDVSVLAGLTGLQTLNLTNTQVSGLDELKNLQTLSLSGTPVSDVSGLDKLKNLQTLNLTNTQVSGLGELKNLQTLDLSGTQVSELNGLGELKSLQALVLLTTQVSELNGLGELKNLQTLILSGTPVRELSGLGELKNLQTLVLLTTPVSELSGLGELKNLQTLWLGNTQVRELSGLGELKNLQTLDLGRTEVSDVSALAGLTGLQRLSLRMAPMSELSGLGELKNLQSLELSGTQVSDVSGLAELTGLQILDLNGTPVSELSGLARLTGLQKLNLRGTLVSDVSGLSELKNLQSLDLSGTKVRDVSGLAGLAGLQELFLNGTPVSDLSGLAHLKDLVIWWRDQKQRVYLELG